MTKFQRKHLSANLDLLWHLKRFGRLPRDILRYYIAPMVMHPYHIVSKNARGNLLLGNGIATYIDRVRVDDDAVDFAQTQAGWIVLTSSASIIYVGMHGEYYRYSACSKQLVDMGYQRAHRLVKVREEFKYISYAAFAERLVPDFYTYVDIPVQLRGMANPHIITIQNTSNRTTLYIWDSNRTVYKVVARVVSVVTATRDLDYVPVCVRGSFVKNIILATWSWGETSSITFFAILDHKPQ